MLTAEYIEQLTDELRKLIRTGATPARLASCHALRDALGVAPELSNRAAGRQMRKRLQKRMWSLSGSFCVCRRTVAADKVVLALQVLLRYDESAKDAPERRTSAMRHLGLSYHVDTWRREPERELLGILAEALAGGDVVAALPIHQIIPETTSLLRVDWHARGGGFRV